MLNGSDSPATPAGVTAADLAFMDRALALAGEAAREGEVPVAALLVVDGLVVAEAGNRRVEPPDPTGHAELRVLREAAARLGGWRLTGATLYVTLEPCPMCAGAIVLARVPRVVFACRDPKAGAVASLYRLLDDPRLNHRCEVVEGARAQESAAMLRAFFGARRRRAGGDDDPGCGRGGRVDEGA